LVEQIRQQGGFMNTRILLAAGLLAAGALPSAAADVSGKWIVSGFATPTCTFTQSGDFFRGACEGPGAKGTAFGVVDQQTIRWTYRWASKADGSAGAFAFEGQIDSDGAMTGAVASTNGTAGQFSAKRQ
jgi:hypothetical protein